ncbi:MAG TPA: TetR/AcrR family transcriptional regulator [Casimicrobiaceae bacterium]
MKNRSANSERDDSERAPENHRTRANDPEQTRRDILSVATHEFADKGLSGARIDEIAAQTRTSKRMIYYYFGSKEGLYIAVLEDAYRNIRNIERDINVDHLSPEHALRELVSFTFDRHQQNPDFVRLVMNENLHSGKYIAQSANIPTLNVPAIDTVRRIVEQGKKSRVFRQDIDPTDLHMTISALCFYSVSNRHTFSTIFKVDMTSAKALAARKKSVIATILAAVRPQREIP